MSFLSALEDEDNVGAGDAATVDGAYLTAHVKYGEPVDIVLTLTGRPSIIKDPGPFKDPWAL